MNFKTFATRFSDALIEEILGQSTIRLIMLMDKKYSQPSQLINLIFDLYQPSDLLFNHRNSIIEILYPSEAEDLAKRLQVDINDNVYDSLKMTNIRLGSKKAIELCNFFSVPHPEKQIIDEKPNIEFIPTKYPLFKHQRVAAKQLKHYLSTSKRRVVLHMPTGSGKTRTAMNVICEHLRETEPTLVIWLAHSQELCEQASEEFVKAWSILGNRDLSVYRYWGNHDINVDEISDGFVVAGLSKTFQSLKKQIRFITELGRKTSLVIMDEAHSAIAETYSLLLDSLVIQKRTTGLIGLTATPGRTWLDMDVDEQLSKFFFKQKVSLSIEGFDSPIDYLVKEGYLASANFISFQHSSSKHFTESEIRSIQKSLDIPASILTKIAEDEQRNLQILLEIEELAKRHKRIIVFATTVHHSDMLAALLSMRGYNARSVTSKSSSIERSQAIQSYKLNDSELKILCNFGVLTTGFDAPNTSAAVIARPTKSLVLYSQMIGRAIRGERAGGNKEADILTIIDKELPGFGSVAEAFNHWEDIWE